jgi:hypothetical protein
VRQHLRAPLCPPLHILCKAFACSLRYLLPIGLGIGCTSDRDVPSLSAQDTFGIGVMVAATSLPVHTRKDSATAQPLVEMATSVQGSRPSPEDKENRLDVTVLGLCSEAALDVVSCALLRYRQSSPNEPLRMSMLKVCALTAHCELRSYRTDNNASTKKPTSLSGYGRRF